MTGRVYLESTEYSVGERDGIVTITVRRDGDTSGEVNASYLTASTSGVSAATPGLDYTSQAGVITIPAGASSATLTITITDDDLPEASEFFAVSLVDLDSGELWFPRTSNVAILDDENPSVDPVDPPQTTPFDVSTTSVMEGLTRPMKVVWLPGEQSKALIAEKDGVIKFVDMASGTSEVLIDIRDNVNSVVDRGLMDIVLHPDIDSNPYIYAFYVVDPPETASNSGNAGQDGLGNRFAHVVRFDIDLDGETPVIDFGSKKIIVGSAGKTLSDISGSGALDYTKLKHENETESGTDPDTGEFIDDYIKIDSLSHAGGALAFGPDGALYISVGDGTSFDYPDPRTKSVQDPDSLSGKILRVDAITGQGLSDNPFADADLDANHSKVFQLGLRNPYRMAFAENGSLFISETGWFVYEEVNMGPAGANFGWPYFEGGDGGELLRAPEYEREPEAADFYAKVASGEIAIQAPFRAFSHNTADPGIQMSAIVGSESVYTGDKYPSIFKNDFFITDVVDGDIFSVDTNDRTQIQYITTIDYVKDGALPVNFIQGPDGYMYFTDYIGGTIQRINIVDPNTPPVVAAEIADQNATEEQEFTFAIPAETFTDADGDILTLAAAQADGSALPGWLSFDPASGTFSGTPLAGDIGALDIKVTSLDGRGGEAFDLFSLTIGSGNAPPVVASAILDQNATEEQPFSFVVPGGTFTDANGDALTLKATLVGGEALPDWLVFDAATATFTGTPDDGDLAGLQVRVTATDPSGASIFDDFALAITPVNDAPFVSAPIAAQTAMVGAPTTISTAPAFTDPDGDALTFDATLSNGDPLPPGFITLDPQTGDFTVNASAGDQGNYAIALSATDGSGATTTDVFGLTIAEANAPPQIAIPLDNLDAVRGVETAFAVPAGAFTDTDGDTLTLTATLANGDPLPGWITLQNGIFTISAPQSTADAFAITVTASDGSASASDSFLLSLSGSTNTPPVVANAIGTQGGTEEQAFSFTVPTGTFSDTDGDALVLTASLASGAPLPGWLSFNTATATFSGAPDDAEVGDLALRVTATDPSGASVNADFTLTIAPVNDDPTVAAPIVDQNATTGNAFSFTLPAATFADVDDTALTLTAALASGDPLPAWLSFDPKTGEFSGTPDAANAGAIEIEVIATDDEFGAVSDVFSLKVANGNTPPVVANPIGAQGGTEEQPFTFIVPAETFFDADGDVLTLSASLATGDPLPNWLNFNAATGTFSGAPDDAEVGELALRVTATEPSGAAVNAEFTLTVTPVNDAPTVAIPIIDQNASADQAFSFTLPGATFADVDDTALTLAATLDSGNPLPAWLIFDPATGGFSGTPLSGNVGTINVQVSATDDEAGTITDVFALTVSPPAPDETLYLETTANQSLEGGPGRDVFVLSGVSGDYNWGPTESGTGVVIWNKQGFDILQNFEELRFTNRSIEVSTVIGNDPVRHDDPDATQHLTGNTNEDRFVFTGPSTDYQWSATQSGQGVVVWRVNNGEGHDILTNFETLEFSDREVDISGIGVV